MGVPTVPKDKQTPRWFRALPIALVLILIAVALTLVALAHWRKGATMLGVALVVAAVLRLVLSEDAAGVLAVRSKRFDIVFCLVLAAVLALAVIGIGSALAD